MKCDGKATETKLHRWKTSLEELLKALLQEEDRIRELRKVVPTKIGQNDWEDCTSPFSGDVENKKQHTGVHSEKHGKVY